MKTYRRNLVKALLGVLLVGWLTTPGAAAQQYFLDEFNSFSGWSTTKGAFASNGRYLYPTSFASDGAASAEKALSMPLQPGNDFSLRLRLAVRTDPYLRVGGFCVALLDQTGQVVTKMNWHDAQASSGFGGVDFNAEGPTWESNPIYRSDPSGFSREYPTIDATLEIVRTGNQWKAFVNGVQKGATLTFNPTLTATRVQIYAADGRWTVPAFEVDKLEVSGVGTVTTANIHVDAKQPVRTADARHFGINAAIWDSVFDTSANLSLLKEMGCQALRFPGGSLADHYHWAGTNYQWAETNPIASVEGTNTPCNVSFDTFAKFATNIGARVIITANYGSGTPEEAAAWVRYSKIKGYGFKYWEVGNEVYGGWEYDRHPQAHDPHTYATEFKKFYEQMKAADSTIKVGAVVAPVDDPGYAFWTLTLLTWFDYLGVTPDFVSYHKYPQQPGRENDANLLQSARTWFAEGGLLRQHLIDYLGEAGRHVELLCTENNSVSEKPSKQTTSLVNGLYLADSVGQILQSEFNSLIWWDLRDRINYDYDHTNAQSLYGWRDFGDQGITGPTNPSGPRYPTFHVAKLLKYFARGGDLIVKATSDHPLLSAYAARRANGCLSLLVINKDRDAWLNGNFTLAGYVPTQNAVVYSYGKPQDDAARDNYGPVDVATTTVGAVGPNFTYPFPPYSVTVISLGSGQARPGWVQFSANSFAVRENSTKATVAVSRLGGGQGPLSVHYATTGGSAVPGADYAVTAGVLNFAHGETWKTFAVPIVNDTIADGEKTITVELLDTVKGVLLGTPRLAAVRIIDDDGYKPDNWIKRSTEILWQGNNCYDGTGDGQALTMTARRGEKRVFHIYIQNDGTGTDSFAVQGGGSDSNFTVRYYTGTIGRIDITSAVTAGTYIAKNLGVGAAQIIRVEITVNAKAPIGGMKPCVIKSTSQKDTSRQDAVKAVVTVKQ